MNWYLEALKKYAVFSGRARRKEYWYFVLFHLIIIMFWEPLTMPPKALLALEWE